MTNNEAILLIITILITLFILIFIIMWVVDVKKKNNREIDERIRKQQEINSYRKVPSGIQPQPEVKTKRLKEKQVKKVSSKNKSTESDLIETHYL